MTATCSCILVAECDGKQKSRQLPASERKTDPSKQRMQFFYHKRVLTKTTNVQVGNRPNLPLPPAAPRLRIR